MLKKMISGGQTGVDRAALDAALEKKIPMGGWCPKGRRAEDGRISDRYPLRETPLRDYTQRTEWNVRDSDGTLILFFEKMSGGTRLTAGLARKMGKPVYLLDLSSDHWSVEAVREWLVDREIQVLNIAGPRENGSFDVYRKAFRAVMGILDT